jgi:hypothetical protein
VGGFNASLTAMKILIFGSRQLKQDIKVTLWTSLSCFTEYAPVRGIAVP